MRGARFSNFWNFMILYIYDILLYDEKIPNIYIEYQLSEIISLNNLSTIYVIDLVSTKRN